MNRSTNSQIKKIGVIVNTKRPRAEGILSELKQLASTYNFLLYAENKEMAQRLGAEYLPIDSFCECVDMVLAMGGDGTMLYAARALYGSELPVMGINLGSLGFLTSVSDTEMDQALKSIASGECQVSKRDMAACQVFQGDQELGMEPALNDIVLGWGQSSRIVTLRLLIDGEAVSSFMCDGMIISTPTGSTGHSLSAGGPILHPGVAGFGINLICPHTLSSRPLVVPISSCIEVEIVHAVKELILSIDGQDRYKMEQGDRIKIKCSPHALPVLQLSGHSYFSVLAKKLHWRGSSL